MFFKALFVAGMCQFGCEWRIGGWRIPTSLRPRPAPALSYRSSGHPTVQAGLVGIAQRMVRAGAALPAVQRQGRWKSPARPPAGWLNSANRGKEPPKSRTTGRVAWRAFWSARPDGVGMDEDVRRLCKKEFDELKDDFEAMCDALTASQVRNAQPLKAISAQLYRPQTYRNNRPEPTTYQGWFTYRTEPQTIPYSRLGPPI